MSLKKNILANYASQIYAVLLNLVMIPLYFRYMGAEAYGLIGIFALLQSWLQLMDMGLTATLSRQVTCYRAGTFTDAAMHALFPSLASLFLLAGLMAALLICGSSHWIATSWLSAKSLSPHLLSQCIALMGIAAVIRWISSLYRAIINGWEKQAWLGYYNIGIATLRYIAVLAIFTWVGVDPLTFFTFQLLVSIIELTIVYWKAGTLLPSVWSVPRFKLKSLQPIWRFLGLYAFAAIVWIFFTQMDKLILSKILTLEDYSYFTIAVMAASGILILYGPITQSLVPRLTYSAI